ncbi:CHH-like protein isoform X2 [Daphnia carinata]|uniref:CHH-like protein isoform X2 n=1 Tax=Daphnia carinata TaxID=120202 RepID=UPI002868809B|nr:CHH-like protein isoform X2 [Daphnia carinata]
MMAAVQQNGRQTPSSYSTRSLLGITTLLVLLLAVLPSYPSSAMSALSSNPHSLSKRSFFDINCKGLYDKSIFARLDRICQDCYSLYREPELHTLCRKNCFTTNYFKGCLDALLINDEKDIQRVMKDISIIHQIPI